MLTAIATSEFDRRIGGNKKAATRRRQQICAYCLTIFAISVVHHLDLFQLTLNPIFRGGNSSHVINDFKIRRRHDDDPVAILHFGPRKTATTFLQDTLLHIPKYLIQEAFVYVGHRDPYYREILAKYLRNCLVDDEATSGCSKLHRLAWTHFVLQLQAYAHAGISVIYSDEGIPTWNTKTKGRALKALDEAFACFRGRRHVAVTYRHYVDWYHSEYNQRQSDRWNNKYVDGIVDWYRTEKTSVPLMKRHIQEYRQSFDYVHVFNMNDLPRHFEDGGGIIAAWLCQTAPWPTDLCHLVRPTNRIPWDEIPSDPNTSDEALEARRLAQLVLTTPNNAGMDTSFGNLTKTNTKRLKKVNMDTLNQTTNKIDKWLSQHKEEELPWLCLDSEELDEVWQMTVQTRDDLIPNYDPSNMVLQERFQNAIQTHRYCQIDYGKVSQLNTWKNEQFHIFM